MIFSMQIILKLWLVILAGIILISGYSHIKKKRKSFECLSPEQLRKGEWGQLSGVQPLRGTTVLNLIVKRTNTNMCDLFYCLTCEKCKPAIAHDLKVVGCSLNLASSQHLGYQRAAQFKEK